MTTLKARRVPNPKKPDGIVAKQYAFLDTQSERFPKLEVTDRNEHIVRAFLMKYWVARYAKKRVKHMERVDALLEKREKRPGTFTKKDDAELQKLLRNKYYHVPHAYDLSGACLLVAQFCYIVFDLPGEVVSNHHHTFIYDHATGTVNDFNMYCTDVTTMKNPYEYDRTYSESERVVSRLRTWNPRIKELLLAFAKEQAAYHATNANSSDCDIEPFAEYIETVEDGKRYDEDADDTDD